MARLEKVNLNASEEVLLEWLRKERLPLQTTPNYIVTVSPALATLISRLKQEGVVSQDVLVTRVDAGNQGAYAAALRSAAERAENETVKAGLIVQAKIAEQAPPPSAFVMINSADLEALGVNVPGKALHGMVLNERELALLEKLRAHPPKGGFKQTYQVTALGDKDGQETVALLKLLRDKGKIAYFDHMTIPAAGDPLFAHIHVGDAMARAASTSNPAERGAALADAASHRDAAQTYSGNGYMFFLNAHDLDAIGCAVPSQARGAGK